MAQQEKKNFTQQLSEACGSVVALLTSRLHELEEDTAKKVAEIKPLYEAIADHNQELQGIHLIVSEMGEQMVGIAKDCATSQANTDKVENALARIYTAEQWEA